MFFQKITVQSNIKNSIIKSKEYFKYFKNDKTGGNNSYDN